MTGNVKIVGTKQDLMCLVGGRRWRVYLNRTNELPAGWNLCLKCADKTLDVERM